MEAIVNLWVGYFVAYSGLFRLIPTPIRSNSTPIELQFNPMGQCTLLAARAETGNPDTIPTKVPGFDATYQAGIAKKKKASTRYAVASPWQREYPSAWVCKRMTFDHAR